METKWEKDLVEKENLIELWTNTRYNEKLLSVTLIYEDDSNRIAKAKIKTMITSPKKEGEFDIEHFEQRCYVGFSDDFYQEMLDKVTLRHAKLERIAAGKDE